MIIWIFILLILGLIFTCMCYLNEVIISFLYLDTTFYIKQQAHSPVFSAQGGFSIASSRYTLNTWSSENLLWELVKIGQSKDTNDCPCIPSWSL